VGQLKYFLGLLGISSFVAHEDIEPSAEWQREIVKAIRTMHAMAALLTPDFHDSNWTDHEVGMALGRDVPVISVRLGATPYGFMSANQAMPATFTDIREMAKDLAIILAKHAKTRDLMAEASVVALETSTVYTASIDLTDVIEIVPTFSENQLSRIEAAARDNAYVSSAFRNVPTRLQETVNRRRATRT
jgi:hypothetical protein